MCVSTVIEGQEYFSIQGVVLDSLRLVYFSGNEKKVCHFEMICYVNPAFAEYAAKQDTMKENE